MLTSVLQKVIALTCSQELSTTICEVVSRLEAISRHISH